MHYKIHHLEDVVWDAEEMSGDESSQELFTAESYDRIPSLGQNFQFTYTKVFAGIHHHSSALSRLTHAVTDRSAYCETAEQTVPWTADVEMHSAGPKMVQSWKSVV